MNEPGKSKGFGFDYAGPSLDKLLNGRSGRFVKSATISSLGLVPNACAAENLLEIAMFLQSREKAVKTWFTSPRAARMARSRGRRTTARAAGPAIGLAMAAVSL
jgi:hypothetical protein